MNESEAVVARRALLSEVLVELNRTMAADVAVGRLARTLVPELADWCVITLVEDNDSRPGRRRLRDVGWWHADPDQRSLVAEYAGLRIGALLDASMLMQAIDTGSVVHLQSGAVPALDRVLAPGRARELVEILAPASLTVVPLRARGRTLGALTLFSGAGRDAPSPDQLDTAVEVARAAALALDNARLYRQQRDVATTFQRSLLSAAVAPDHMQIAVRYQPAAEAARVGGDWYDAFMQPAGATVLVIGDVVGHDIEAAALMAQLRSMLRAIAITTEAGPAEVLHRLDAAIRTLQLPAMATVLVARVEQTADEVARGVTRLRWSSAGHPPPLVITADGGAAVLDRCPNGLLLGVDPDRERHEAEVVLDRGSTVLLYTDGLVERRTRSLSDGIDQLTEALELHAGLDLESLCDALLTTMPVGPGEDDIALVAARLHRQDRPRPAAAGPVDVPPDVPEGPEVEGEALA